MRLRYMFWLDLNKEIEYEIAEEIENLKERRSFVSTIRDGIRLILDLRRGKTDVLNALFPWVLEHVQLSNQTDDAPLPAPEMIIQEQLERLEKLILQHGAVPVTQGPPSNAPVPKALNKHDFDDETPQIEIRKAESNSSWGALIAFTKLTKSFHTLPSEVLRYGLETKKLALDDLPPTVREKLASVPASSTPREKTSGNARSLANANPLPIPDFDDDDSLDIEILN